jgi:hypothetical protein
MTETSKCLNYRCRTVVEGSVLKCPECGTRMRTPKAVRGLGWAMVGLGAFLVCFMGYIWLSMAPMLAYPGQEVTGGGSFTGTADQARMIATLFGAVILFGIGTIGNGVYQIVIGRRSTVIMIIVLLLAAGLFGYAFLTTQALR